MINNFFLMLQPNKSKAVAWFRVLSFCFAVLAAVLLVDATWRNLTSPAHLASLWVLHELASDAWQQLLQASPADPERYVAACKANAECRTHYASYVTVSKQRITWGFVRGLAIWMIIAGLVAARTGYVVALLLKIISPFQVLISRWTEPPPIPPVSPGSKPIGWDDPRTTSQIYADIQAAAKLEYERQKAETAAALGMAAAETVAPERLTGQAPASAPTAQMTPGAPESGENSVTGSAAQREIDVEAVSRHVDDIQAAIAQVTAPTGKRHQTAGVPDTSEATEASITREPQQGVEAQILAPRVAVTGSPPAVMPRAARPSTAPQTSRRNSERDGGQGTTKFELIHDALRDRKLLVPHDRHVAGIRKWVGKERGLIMGLADSPDKPLTLRTALAAYTHEALTVWVGIKTVLPNAPDFASIPGSIKVTRYFPTSDNRQLSGWRLTIDVLRGHPEILAWLSEHGARFLGHPARRDVKNPGPYHPGVKYELSRLRVPLTTLRKEKLLGDDAVPAEAVVEVGGRQKIVFIYLPPKE